MLLHLLLDALTALQPPAPAACAQTARTRMPGLRRGPTGLAALLALWAFQTPGAYAQLPGTATVTTPHVTAELQAYAPQGLQPQAPLWLGLRIEHQPGWHTYWKNAGDSGLPTEFEWRLPAGLSAGPIAWPVPRKIPVGPLANYGYEDTVLLPVPLTVDAGFQPSPLGTVDIRLHARWLVCRVECIPEEGDFSLRLNARSSTAIHGAAFEAALASQPRDLPAHPGQRVAIDPAAPAGTLDIALAGLPPAWQGQRLEFLTETPELIETGAEWQQHWQGDQWLARVPLSAYRQASPDTLPLVVTLTAADGGLQGWRAELPIQGAWPAAVAPVAAAPATASPWPRPDAAQDPLPAGPASPASWPAYLAALAGALLGGLLLNVMPCVFPVLAIKAMGMASHAGDRPAQRRAGLAYAAGVILSLTALAALLLSLRAAGQAVGWGFQLQSPGVVAGLAALFTVLGLQMAGLFQTGSVLPSSLATRQLRHPTLNAGLSGVLAVAVASPCTAPFMGASLGYTLTLPAGQTLLLFATMGLGLALPFLILSWVPRAAGWLPRPGPWMENLRQLMAFPLFGTVVWLVWVLGQLGGGDSVAALLALLVALAMLLWSLGRPGRLRPPLAAFSLAVLLALAWLVGPTVVREEAPATASTQVPAGGWVPWSPAQEQALLDQGRTVFVDYTAAWCITCQFNKKTVLDDAEVQAIFRRRNVALLRADWTRRDAAITAALASLGRNGVPVYVLHKPGRPPHLLPEILSTNTISQALAAD